MAFWFLVAAYVVAWGWAAAVLPERVPLHFDVSGTPDNWGSRTELLVVMGLVGGATAALLGALSWSVGRLPLTASWVNLPHKQWWTATPERTSRAQRMLTTDLHVLSTIIMAILLCALLATVHAAGQPAHGMHPLGLIAVCALVVLALLWSGWLALARYRPRADGA